MSKLEKYQGMIFDGSNMPDFYRYIADYLEEHPDCKSGFGLLVSSPSFGEAESMERVESIVKVMKSETMTIYHPAPLTRTMYNIHTGEAVEVPLDVAKVFDQSIYTIIMERKYDEYREKLFSKP